MVSYHAGVTELPTAPPPRRRRRLQAGRPRRARNQGVRTRGCQRARARRPLRRLRRRRSSPPSWGRPVPASRRCCTASRASTRSPPARCSSATRSSVRLNDTELTLLRRRRIGFIFQSFNLVPTLNALDNITLPLAIAGRGTERRAAQRRGHVDRARRPPQAPPQRAVRWPAAARRGGPRSRLAARHHLCGRAHRQPRLARRRGAARLPAHGRGELQPDDRHGHPRPARGRARRPGGVHRGRHHRRRDDLADRPTASSTS